MMLGERAAEIELTEGRVTPNIKTRIAFIQARHKPMATPPTINFFPAPA